MRLYTQILTLALSSFARRQVVIIHKRIRGLLQNPIASHHSVSSCVSALLLRTNVGEKSYKKLVGAVLVALSCVISAAAETLIIGRVTDKADGLPLASVNVCFENGGQGTTTDAEGYFLLCADDEGGKVTFSMIGYRTEEIRVRGGEAAFINMEMREQSTMLNEIFVFPGSNPALDWMKRVRLMRKANDLTTQAGYSARGTEQSLVLLSRQGGKKAGRNLLEQLQAGNLVEGDTTLLVPLYMAETEYDITHKGMEEKNRQLFSTPSVADRLVMQLSEGLSPELNFYRNAVTVFGKSIVSPLANIGNAYYSYYLADSVTTAQGKEYEIHFRSKNPKNPAFNGVLRIDSASLSLTYIEAALPRQANFNYVHGLTVRRQYDRLPEGAWVPRVDELSVAMSYNLFDDTSHPSSELLLHRRLSLLTDAFPVTCDAFAGSAYSVETLESRMQALDDTPLMRTAKWIVDAVITSYARVGCIDVGPLQKTMRLTEQEGFRPAIPLRTNERLWQNVSVGGYVGYGFRNHSWAYSAFGQVALPGNKRQVIGLSYTRDYRRIDYDYNDFVRREDVWDSGDEDIISTLFSFVSANRISPRREWELSYAFDWNRNVESSVYLRAHTLMSDEYFPLCIDGLDIGSIATQSLTLLTRFSFGEQKYSDHLRRLYSSNGRPVLYLTGEIGRYRAGSHAGMYGKLKTSAKQRIPTALGTWRYLIEAGCVIGRVPYPLLEASSGNEPSGVAFHQFNRMRYMEFAHDRYVQLNTEFLFNGLIFNHIPVIKHLNMREFVALKMVMGALREEHRSVLDFPELTGYLSPLAEPYVEGSVGVTNILGIFTLQFNYRFTNHNADLTPGRVAFGLRFGF